MSNLAYDPVIGPRRKTVYGNVDKREYHEYDTGAEQEYVSGCEQWHDLWEDGVCHKKHQMPGSHLICFIRLLFIQNGRGLGTILCVL